MKPVRLLIVGAGGRGGVYAGFAAAHPEGAKVVAVAEPRDFHRNRMVAEHQIEPAAVFTDWRELADRPRLADAAVICTQDAMHVEPTIALAAKGYHILLEKPMAPTEGECVRIVEAVRKAGVLFAVCHVLRYTDYTSKLKALLKDGLIGDVVNIQHLEPVGYWHQAHSFVRGSFRNTAESSPMLLAKSCHDIDWVSYVMGRPCRRVSSFGSLLHFRRESKPAPAGAATRCVECPFDPQCPYSAIKIYVGRTTRGYKGWPVDVVSPDSTSAGIWKALVSGPYGRCVYECDNDVVDHQVVNMEFEGGPTAAFTMTAFNAGGGRKTRIFGTRGELYGEESKLEHYDFLRDQKHEIDTTSPDSDGLGGHGGGDGRLMECFIQAVAAGDPSPILSGPDATLESHRMVFAAERSRLEGRVVTL